MDPQSNSPDDRHQVTKSRILLVDDNDDLRSTFQVGLEGHGCEVLSAATVNEALRLISVEKFDVLLSDLHMPNAGDGLTVVSAMRHAHPNAITLVQSGYPAVDDATHAVLLQVGEISPKSSRIRRLVCRLTKSGSPQFCRAPWIQPSRIG